MCDRNLRRGWKIECPAEWTSTPENLIKLCLPWKTAGTNCAVSQSNGPESSVSILTGGCSIYSIHLLQFGKTEENNYSWWLNTAGVLLLKSFIELNCTFYAYLKPMHLYICFKNKLHSTCKMRGVLIDIILQRLLIELCSFSELF